MRAKTSSPKQLGRPKAALELTDEERQQLMGYVRRGKVSQQLALRARIVLRCADGCLNRLVADELGISEATVCKWRGRFVKARVAGLSDAPRTGAPRRVGDERIEEIVRMTLERKPENATHWSTRGLAKKLGLSQSTVSRVWRAFQLKPHRVETYSLSKDPAFVEKVRDIVGLYMNPPDNALVLCVDEKSQIQALERTQPVLPMMPGVTERQTHGYFRHGTTTLFAALDARTGQVLGSCYRRHRTQEFVKFLTTIDNNVPKNLDVHLILDNYATHKAPPVKRWLELHPRFNVHFTPTYSSWMNLVERWFGLLSERKIKRSSHRSTVALEKDIKAYIAANNDELKPFIWTKSADEIFASIGRYCLRTLDAVT
jgi:transposase